MIYLVLQCDATGIMRRLLKFPPVEDVGILIRLACSYKERILTGKGVTIPQIIHETVDDDPLRSKNEIKSTPLLITNPIQTNISYADQIDSIMELLQGQAIQ